MTSETQDRTHAAFAIRRVEIFNIGSVDHIELSFPTEQQSLDLIYAGNGVGKTTVLEAMSLLGHLACMPVCGTDGVRPSLLRRVLQQPNGMGKNHSFEKLLHDRPIDDTTLESWMKRARADELKSIGAVRFVVTDCHDAHGVGVGTYSTSFIVLINWATTAQTEPLLTPLLSRDGAGGTMKADLSLEEYFHVMVDKPVNAARGCADFDELELRIARGRTFSLDGTKHQPFGELIADDSMLGWAVGPCRRVSYINTDLNDFGRGNDLRESPKNIAESLDSEVIDRFGVRFDPVNAYVYPRLLEMNTALKQVLSAANNNYGDVYAVDGGLSIENFQRMPCETKTRLTAKRNSGLTFPVQFMSAGENEVFFVLLMCQVMSSRGGDRGLILLDEPDLHVASPMRSAFFEAIIDAVGAGTQLVICTHSPVALDVLRRRAYPLKDHVRVLYRRYVDDKAEKTKLDALFDSRYLSKLGTKFADASVLRRSQLGLLNWLMALRGHWIPPLKSESSREWVGQGLAVATLALLVVMVYAGTIAVLNDFFNVTDVPEKGLFFTVYPGNFVTKLLGHKTVMQVHDDVRTIATGSSVSLICLLLVQAQIQWSRRAKLWKFKKRASSQARTM